MTIRHLQLFVEVCAKGSVTAAAESLLLSQPSVSQAILQIERDYNVRLFDRIGNRLSLTDAGERLLVFAKQITTLFSEMEESLLTRHTAAIVRIGSSITIGSCLLPKYLSSYAKICPETEVRVQVENSAAVEKLILDNALDFALVEGIVSSQAIRSFPFSEDELILVCGAESHLWNTEAIEPAALSSLSFILREPGSGAREIFEAAMLSHELSFTSSWQSTSTEAIINAVIENLGVTVIPWRLAKQEIDAGRLHRIRVPGIDFARKFYLIQHKDKHLSPAAEALREFILSQEAD